MSAEGRAVATVSRSALRENVRLVRERVSPAKLMAVVKDDAYGHGLREAVGVFADEGITRFGALDLDSALAVRALLPDATVFAWVFPGRDDLREAVRARIDIGVGDAAMLERVTAVQDAAADRARVHLKIDSGLHRSGVLPRDWSAFVSRAARLQAQERIHVAGLWTHIAEASYDADTDALRVFASAVTDARIAGVTPETLHVAASAAAFGRADARFGMVRVGAFLYGIAPGGGVGPEKLGLRPAMTLTAPVLEVVRIGGHRFARIGIGSLDGLLSDAEGKVDVLLEGRRARLAVVEPLSALVELGSRFGEESSSGTRGSTVTLFGDPADGAPTLQEWADPMGTIGEEIVTRLTARVSRAWTD